MMEMARGVTCRACTTDMKLNQITSSLLRKAIRLYLDIAYEKPEDREKHWPGFCFDARLCGEELISHFIDESHYTEDVLSQRYVLRLGNSRYPHMKFVVEEFAIPNEFYMAVDTHDQMPMRKDNPEYGAWQELREFNRKIKSAVEKKWTEEGLPTLHAVRTSIQEEMRPAKRKRTSVLVVDDEEEMGKATKMMLESGGYKAKLVCRGQDALDSISESRPDLVLLDIEMPEMDGYEVCRRIRQNPGTRELPILLATSGTGEMIYTLDADGFLAKPFQRNILLTFVSHVLKGKRRRP